MKFWTVCFAWLVIACFTGCSPQKSSSVDPALTEVSPDNGQGKPVAPEEWPYFDWESLGDGPMVRSTAVVVDAGAKQHSDENLLVTLKGQAHTINQHPIVQVRWWQHAGPAAVIANPNQLKTQVLLPEVLAPTTAVFRFAAVNANGEVNSDFVSVLIRPLETPLKVMAKGVVEEDSEILFVVSLSEPAQQRMTFQYFTEDGSAIAGEDYLSVRGALTFYPGQTHKTVSVRVLEDNTEEHAEVFYLRLQGEFDGQEIELKRLGLIVDQELPRNLLSSIPFATNIPAALSQSLPAIDGLPRMFLQSESGVELRLVVEDPCGQVIAVTDAPSGCEGFLPVVQSGQLPPGSFYSDYQNIAWNTGAPAGDYKVYLEHVSGDPAEYVLYIFGLDGASGSGIAKEFSGLMANGERILITGFWHEGSGESGGHRIIGTLVNATNARPIEQAATARFMQDGNEVFAVPLAANFNIPLPAGTYSMSVTAEGYLDWSRDITIGRNEPLNLQVSLSPILVIGDEAARIVLSWGATPSDLDSHLRGFGSANFHLFFGNKRLGHAVLDVDDTNAFGPETITIHSWNDGLYRYYVRDFSNGGRTTSTALANSSAVVQVYLGSDSVQVFQVPNTPGYLWHVFDFDPTTNELIPVNQIVLDEQALNSAP